MFVRLLCVAIVFAAGLPLSATAAEDRIVADCTAPKPAPGQRFSGPVMQVIDGGRLCVALTPEPSGWIEVAPAGVMPASLADGDRRSLLMATTFAKTVDCVAVDAHDSSVAADCSVDGLALGEAMRAQKVQPDWRTWR
jgi:hypothetical protein